MSTGRFYVKQNGRTFLVEPISEHALRNADWGQTDTTNLPTGGAVHPNDSIITDDKFKNIVTLEPGVSPFSYIEKLVNEGKR